MDAKTGIAKGKGEWRKRLAEKKRARALREEAALLDDSNKARAALEADDVCSELGRHLKAMAACSSPGPPPATDFLYRHYRGPRIQSDAAQLGHRLFLAARQAVQSGPPSPAACCALAKTLDAFLARPAAARELDRFLYFPNKHVRQYRGQYANQYCEWALQTRRILACADERELDRIPFCTRELDARAHWVGFASPAVFGDPTNGKGGYRDTVLSRERKRLPPQDFAWFAKGYCLLLQTLILTCHYADPRL